MAAWHFRLTVLPRKSVVKIHGSIPTTISQYTAKFHHPEDSILEESLVDYWCDSKLSTIEVENEIKLMFDQVHSWSEDARMYGHLEKDKIEIWQDDISVRIDCREIDMLFINRVLELSKKYDCLLVLNEGGLVVEPDIFVLYRYIKSSFGFKFCDNPEQAIKELPESSKIVLNVDLDDSNN